MGAPDYATALDGLVDASPVVFETLLRQAAEPLGATEVTVYLADVQHVVLQPILLSPDWSDPTFAEEAGATSMAADRTILMSCRCCRHSSQRTRRRWRRRQGAFRYSSIMWGLKPLT